MTGLCENKYHKKDSTRPPGKAYLSKEIDPHGYEAERWHQGNLMPILTVRYYSSNNCPEDPPGDEPGDQVGICGKNNCAQRACERG